MAVRASGWQGTRWRTIGSARCYGPEACCRKEEGQPFLLVMPVTSSGFVYIFGGGHVSRELVPVLAHVGFRPVIFEDRPDFADPKDFPGAVQTLVGDLANFGASIQVRRQDYIGHHDPGPYGGLRGIGAGAAHPSPVCGAHRQPC